jgi:hypothetical protein
VNPVLGINRIKNCITKMVALRFSLGNFFQFILCMEIPSPFFYLTPLSLFNMRVLLFSVFIILLYKIQNAWKEGVSLIKLS